ncbi:hypothetical protein GS399_20495 [Pedobacter sp. HMF7647]|uniref:Uncharacterized protein n=1 Tax=Hufsiella arboris TaxID=2695275 RepID=A0A7K1YFH1_9SPHI|nr:hypothetical protein [Hufsiella arboris]MXV53346.1 hypothetical protein [Hufsiella arboris]
MLEKLTRQYEIQTSRTKVEILEQISKKALIQKDNSSFIPTDEINYRKFKFENDRIEIELWPNIFNPFRGYGTIYFDFQDSKTGTKIKSTIEAYSKYVIVGGGCFTLFFLVLFSVAVLYIVKDSFLTAFIFVLFAWLIAILPTYLMFRFSSNWLEQYSKKILNDLNL